MDSSGRLLTSIEICAGAGGQAVGLHEAGFKHLALVEIDEHACDTLEANVKEHPDWDECKVIRGDVKDFADSDILTKFNIQPGDLDLLAGGVPCPPFSIAGKQLGEDDERDLFPTMLDLVDKLLPKAVMIENVRGILGSKFSKYRDEVIRYRLVRAGYDVCWWELLEARDFGVPQLRPRAILVAIKKEIHKSRKFIPPTSKSSKYYTVAEALEESMRDRFSSYGKKGDEAFDKWFEAAQKKNDVAPTLVGGSKKHGGADLGPSRAKKAWAELGVNALGVANDTEECNPDRDLFREQGPMLTIRQAAIIQGFPNHWKFKGKKTARYRQVGNAFPPPVAEAVGRAIVEVLQAASADTARTKNTAEQFDLVTGDESASEFIAPITHRSNNLESAGVC